MLSEDNMTVSEPPVAPTVYVDPAPTTKRFIRSGVPLEPSHNAHPDGIFVVCPDHNSMIPDGNVDERNSFPRIHALVFPIISFDRICVIFNHGVQVIYPFVLAIVEYWFPLVLNMIFVPSDAKDPIDNPVN